MIYRFTTLEADQAGGELDFAWAAEEAGVGREEGLGGGVEGELGRAVEGDLLGAEVAIGGGSEVEDVQVEVEVVALAFEGEVLDEAEVGVVEGRLAELVADGLDAVDEGAVVEVVGVVLGVEADERGVGQAGVGDEDGIELETERKVEDGGDVEGMALVEGGVSAFGLEVKRIEGGVDGVGAEVGVVVAVAGEGVVEGDLRAGGDLSEG